MDSVASRYAIALLSIAREECKIKIYNDEVEQLISIIENNPDLIRILKDYGLSNEEKKQTLDVLFKNKIQNYLLNLMYIVIDNKRGAYLKDILVEFNKIALKEMNIRRGIVYTTISLTASEIKQLELKVSKILNANVTLINKIDNSLIGGLKITVDDYIMDDSIKSRLEKLKENLIIGKGV